MNGKYILALFLALQVSVILCEIPAPDPELVAKVEDMKKTLNSRLRAAVVKVERAAAPYVESARENVHYKRAMVFYADEVMNAQFQDHGTLFTLFALAFGLVGVASDLVGDVAHAVEKAERSALGLYSVYLRPQVGESLEAAVAEIKKFLNVYLPAE